MQFPIEAWGQADCSSAYQSLKNLGDVFRPALKQVEYAGSRGSNPGSRKMSLTRDFHFSNVADFELSANQVFPRTVYKPKLH